MDTALRPANGATTRTDEEMVSHLVLMKPRPDLSPADREDFIGAFERALRQIPTVRDVRIGKRITHGAGYESSALDLDYLATIDFDDLDGLQTYLRHPAHLDLGMRFGRALSGALVYDFEVGGVEVLGDIVGR
jgi:hypothetical protein